MTSQRQRERNNLSGSHLSKKFSNSPRNVFLCEKERKKERKREDKKERKKAGGEEGRKGRREGWTGGRKLFTVIC